MSETEKSKAEPGRASIFTVADEVARVDAKRPHIVIVGAGASVAAFPNGDRNGKKLPTMPNFASTLGLDSVLHRNGIPPPYEDFEGIYTAIVSDLKKQQLAREIEQIIDDYFCDLELPDTPTLYDHLILSLRPKDVIATFNWDPFLCQALVRNNHFAHAPHILFLHGNTAIGVCMEHREKGPRENYCSKCDKPYASCRLLYPVLHKNYNADGFIADEWETLKRVMRHAFALTLFGYGAPKTDVEAVGLMRLAWGTSKERVFEEIEMIDKKDEEQLVHTWSDFIHTHHYQTCTNFYDSLMARHPRRTCEHLWARFIEGRWPSKWKEFPRGASFDELYRWLEPRLAAEQDS